MEGRELDPMRDRAEICQGILRVLPKTSIGFLDLIGGRMLWCLWRFASLLPPKLAAANGMVWGYYADCDSQTGEEFESVQVGWSSDEFLHLDVTIVFWPFTHTLVIHVKDIFGKQQRFVGSLWKGPYEADPYPDEAIDEAIMLILALEAKWGDE